MAKSKPIRALLKVWIIVFATSKHSKISRYTPKSCFGYQNMKHTEENYLNWLNVVSWKLGVRVNKWHARYSKKLINVDKILHWLRKFPLQTKRLLNCLFSSSISVAGLSHEILWFIMMLYNLKLIYFSIKSGTPGTFHNIAIATRHITSP